MLVAETRFAVGDANGHPRSAMEGDGEAGPADVPEVAEEDGEVGSDGAPQAFELISEKRSPGDVKLMEWCAPPFPR